METEKELENIYTIELNMEEYKYLVELLNNLYDDLKRLPKRMRTQKFYILEDIKNKQFSTK